jgi:cell division protein FtsB
MFEDNSRKAEIERRKAALRERRARREKEGSKLSGIGSVSPTRTAKSTVVDTPVRRTRRSVPVSPADVEFVNPRKRTRRQTPAKVKYVGNKNKLFSWNMTPTKLGWLVCFGLFLRLIFMDNGVLDYHRMENHISEKEYHLESVKQENAGLVTEIHRIKTVPSYQKKLAREHLGVIAADEYMILFAQDSASPSI